MPGGSDFQHDQRSVISDQTRSGILTKKRKDVEVRFPVMDEISEIKIDVLELNRASDVYSSVSLVV